MVVAMLVPAPAGAEVQTQLVGTVTDFHGKYGLVVRDARGRVVEVALHQGTIIKPQGLRLERGMHVTIIGRGADSSFAAGEIDTAYQLPPARTGGPRPGTEFPGPAGRNTPADNGRFNSFPGDVNGSRVPDLPDFRGRLGGIPRPTTAASTASRATSTGLGYRTCRTRSRPPRRTSAESGAVERRQRNGLCRAGSRVCRSGKIGAEARDRGGEDDGGEQRADHGALLQLN
jgi:hypothetical protein